MLFPILIQFAYIPAQKKRSHSLFVTMDKKYCIEMGLTFVQQGSTEQSRERWTQVTFFPVPIPLSLNKKTSVIPTRPLTRPCQRETGDCRFKRQTEPNPDKKGVKKHG